jgi:hypothetical protein
MIARRLSHAPRAGFRMLALKIFENHSGVVHVLGFPESFWKDDPMERPCGAFLQYVAEGMTQEGLGMPHKSNFTGAQSELLPNQAHQSITVRAATGIAVAASSEDETDLLGRSSFPRNRSRGLIGKSLDYQGMRGVHVVVMNGEVRAGSPGLSDGMSKSLALEQIEIESGGQNKDLALTLARNRGRQ